MGCGPSIANCCSTDHTSENELQPRPHHHRLHRKRKQSTQPPAQEPSEARPQGFPQLVPEPQRDEQGLPIRHEAHDLNRRNLQRALHYVADFMHDHRNNVTIIAVGGAVNTILLKTRDVTHDVDFFNGNLTTRASQADLLRQAAVDAAARSSVPLGGNWLNNSTILFMSHALQLELTKQAIEQNEVIFEEPGLKVLAAPWHYAMCAKLERMGKSNRRQYDVSDAAVYLHRYISLHGNQPVTAEQILHWAAHFKLRCSYKSLRELNEAYKSKYHADGIVLAAEVEDE